jgi:glutaredoxin
MLPHHQTPSIVMYTTFGCASCKALGQYLEQHGVPFQAVNLSLQPQLSQLLVNETGLRMVPQVFFRGQLIGGYNEVVNLHRQGQLV